MTDIVKGQQAEVKIELTAECADESVKFFGVFKRHNRNSGRVVTAALNEIGKAELDALRMEDGDNKDAALDAVDARYRAILDENLLRCEKVPAASGGYVTWGPSVMDGMMADLPFATALIDGLRAVAQNRKLSEIAREGNLLKSALSRLAAS